MKDHNPTLAKRPSMEARFRAWTAQSSAVAIDEQHLKDAETVARGTKRRWGIIGAGLILLAALRWANISDFTAVHGGAVLVIAIAANLAAVFIARSGVFAWWFVYCSAVLDILIVGALVVLIGPGGIVVAFLVAILPYTFDEGRGVGHILALLAASTYVGAAAAHGAFIASPPVGLTELAPTVYVEALVFLVVASTLRRIPASLVERIRVSRAVMRQAEAGALRVRAPAGRNDELGFLEKSFNRILDEIADTIEVVQRETDEAVILAQVLSQASAGVLASSESVSASSTKLARDMASQRELAAEGRQESTTAAKQAGALSHRAEDVVADVGRLAEAADHSRSSVERTGKALFAMGEEVRNTAVSVHELNRMSQRVGSFAKTISRIARQTHVLALNAAIEAAHSEEAGEGFAAVADEVRALAAEARTSAREVSGLIDDVLTRVDAVARAMTSGEERVRDVEVFARQAHGALGDLQSGISHIKELVEDSALVSRAQEERMVGLAGKMADMARVSTTSANEADGATAAMATQQRTLGDLEAVSAQLAELGERIGGSIAHFIVRPHNPTSVRSTHAPRGIK